MYDNGFPLEIWVYNVEPKTAQRILSGFSPYSIDEVDETGNITFTERIGEGMTHYDERTLKYNAAENNVTVLDYKPGPYYGSTDIPKFYDSTYLSQRNTASLILNAMDSCLSYDIDGNNLYVLSKPKPGSQKGIFVVEVGCYDLTSQAYTPLLNREYDIQENKISLVDRSAIGISVITETQEISFYEKYKIYKYSIPQKAFTDGNNFQWNILE